MQDGHGDGVRFADVNAAPEHGWRAARADASQAEARAVESGGAGRRAAYLSTTYAAAQSRLGGNYAAARRLLASLVPAAGAEDLRGIEWRILMEQRAPDVPARSFQMADPVLAITAPVSGRHFWAAGGRASVKASNVGSFMQERSRCPPGTSQRSRHY